MLLENHPYRHYKGGLYIAKYTALDSETLEEKVVYQSCSTGQIWVRPSAIFFEIVEQDGQLMNRFTPVIFNNKEGS